MVPAIDVGLEFISRTLGHTGLSAYHQQTFWCILKSISALGNLVVVTFTAARGKMRDNNVQYMLTFSSEARNRKGRNPSILSGLRPKLRPRCPLSTKAFAQSRTR